MSEITAGNMDGRKMRQLVRKHIFFIEFCCSMYPVKLFDQSLNLFIYGSAVICRICAVCGFHGKLIDPLHDVLSLVHGTVSDLHKGDTVNSIVQTLFQASDLSAHFFGYGKAGSVIRRPVYPVSAGKLFSRFCDTAIYYLQFASPEHRRHIVPDAVYNAHDL